MTVRDRRGLLSRTDSTLLAACAVSVGVVLGLLLPWLRADPPAGLTFSNSPYTDEGLYNSAGRDLVMFGSFGHTGLFRQLTNPAYVLADSTVFAVAGPSITAARVLSVVSVCAMVVLLLWGLARLIGFPAALVSAACVAGSPIVLLYGHVGIVEPFEAAMLVAGFVALARGMAAGRWVLGAVGGLLLAAAVGSKESALLALPGILGVPLVGALVMRQWRRLAVAGSAVAALFLAVLVWFLAVAQPNRSELHSATQTFGYTSTGAYPHSLDGTFHRLWHWSTHPALTDHASGWSIPLLVAAGLGILFCVLLSGFGWRRRARLAHVYVTISGLVWAAGGWAVPVLSGYAPNRYLVIAVPGLALVAGPGLGLGSEWVAGRVHRPMLAALAGGVAALMVLVPGVITYIEVESPVWGRDQLRADQVAVARVIPPGAVLFGEYAPEMAFSHRAHTVIPWPQSGLHMDSPAQRYGLSYVIADISGAASADDRATLRAVAPGAGSLGRPLVTVPWGPHRLAVYRVGAP